jgi:hypothetical protein
MIPTKDKLDLAQVTKAYVNIRDARSQLRKEYEANDDELKIAQTKLEALMLKHLNEHGMESVRTEAGTFYRQEEIIPTCADWNALYDWIREHNAFDALERRVKKTFVKDFLEEHEGMLPPGISVLREYQVRVRRSS